MFGKVVLAGDRHAHAKNRFHDQRICACGASAVDVGELDHKVIHTAGLGHHAGHAVTSSSIASGIRMVDFCISQAAVGQRSAHSPQCTQTSSSLTMTRAVCGSAAETYSDCERLAAGAVNRVRSSA